MIAILLAVLSMAAQDATGTFLVVAEAKGRAWLAGVCDLIGDHARLICTIVGAGTVIKTGVNMRSIVIVEAMAVTSLIGTAYWTKLGRRIKPHVVIVVDQHSEGC